MPPAPPAVWTLHAPTAPESATTTAAPAVDIDPRHRLVRLACQPRSGGAAEVMGGAVLRHHLVGVDDPVDWAPAVAWLRGDEAAALLRQIGDGYTAEMLWSGDWTARWSPEARDAARALIQALEDLLTCQ